MSVMHKEDFFNIPSPNLERTMNYFKLVFEVKFGFHQEFLNYECKSYLN